MAREEHRKEAEAWKKATLLVLYSVANEQLPNIFKTGISFLLRDTEGGVVEEKSHRQESKISLLHAQRFA